MSGYYGIAIYRPKFSINVGTLFRSALIYNASFVAVIDGQYKRQPTDTYNSSNHLPFFTYSCFDLFEASLPNNISMVGVELIDSAILLPSFLHPKRAVYLFGCENGGLPGNVLSRCPDIVKLPGNRSLNVAVAGSIVIYDRVTRLK